MDVLFVHQNMPGQFGHLAAHLAARRGNHVAFLTQSDRQAPAGVTRVLYRPARMRRREGHHYLHDLEAAVVNGQAAANACVELKRRGFSPDVVVAHPGWGEALYVKDVFPATRLVSYCEFFYRSEGADVGFDPTERVDVDVAARVRTRNAHLLLTMDAADCGISPTHWQRSVHPEDWRRRIHVAFDGIDAERARPDLGATFALPGGPTLSRRDTVITFVARNLEPYRGFPSFMRAVPAILRALPEARIVIVGSDRGGYGPAPAGGATWRQLLCDEVRPNPARVHFTGPLPYDDYLRLLRISSAHVYLTVPFVLSWSAVEALASGCVVVGSRTPPVEEVIREGENGLLVDFFDTRAIAERVVEAVRRGPALDPLRRRARQSVLGRYDLATCLPRLETLLGEIAHGRTPEIGPPRRGVAA